MRPTADWTLLDLAHWWEVKAYTCLKNISEGGTLFEIAEEYARLSAYCDLSRAACTQHWRSH